MTRQSPAAGSLIDKPELLKGGSKPIASLTPVDSSYVEVTVPALGLGLRVAKVQPPLPLADSGAGFVDGEARGFVLKHSRLAQGDRLSDVARLALGYQLEPESSVALSVDVTLF